MKEFETFALAMIYPSLPEHIKHKVMTEVLKRCGFKFSLADLEIPKAKEPPKLKAMPIYKPAYYCPMCRVKLKEFKKDEELTPKLEATLLDRHLPNCLVFQIFEKHRATAIAESLSKI